MKIFIETERLFLREILPTDVDGLFELDADPEVHRYLGNNPIKTNKQAIDIINFIRQQYVDHGIGRWAVIDKQTNSFMGWAGLKLVTEQTNDHINYLDLGYRLIKKYWGQGFATEAATASLAYAFNKLHAPEVYAMTACDNTGSHKVLIKVGLKFIETFVHQDIKHNWYTIDRKEFESKTPISNN